MGANGTSDCAGCRLRRRVMRGWAERAPLQMIRAAVIWLACVVGGWRWACGRMCEGVAVFIGLEGIKI